MIYALALEDDVILRWFQLTYFFVSKRVGHCCRIQVKLLILMQ
jgi:hypothetical protein